jgi:hypothetical protein
LNRIGVRYVIAGKPFEIVGWEDGVLPAHFQVVSRGWKALQTGVSEAHHDEIPTENEVVNFPWLDNWPGALSTGGSERGRE